MQIKEPRLYSSSGKSNENYLSSSSTTSNVHDNLEKEKMSRNLSLSIHTGESKKENVHRISNFGTIITKNKLSEHSPIETILDFSKISLKQNPKLEKISKIDCTEARKIKILGPRKNFVDLSRKSSENIHDTSKTDSYRRSIKSKLARWQSMSEDNLLTYKLASQNYETDFDRRLNKSITNINKTSETIKSLKKQLLNGEIHVNKSNYQQNIRSTLDYRRISEKLQKKNIYNYSDCKTYNPLKNASNKDPKNELGNLNLIIPNIWDTYQNSLNHSTASSHVSRIDENIEKSYKGTLNIHQILSAQIPNKKLDHERKNTEKNRGKLLLNSTIKSKDVEEKKFTDSKGNLSSIISSTNSPVNRELDSTRTSRKSLKTNESEHPLTDKSQIPNPRIDHISHSSIHNPVPNTPVLDPFNLSNIPELGTNYKQYTPEEEIKRTIHTFEKIKKQKLSELKNYEKNENKFPSKELALQKYIDYLNSKLEFWQGKLKSPNSSCLLLSPIAKPVAISRCIDVSDKVCRKSGSIVTNKDQLNLASINSPQAILDISANESTKSEKNLSQPIGSFDQSNESNLAQDNLQNNTMDTLNDQPTDEKFAVLGYYMTWSDENILPLVEIAVEQLFYARQNKLGTTSDAFDICCQNMPKEFLEINSESEITRIYNQWRITEVMDNSCSNVVKAIDRRRVYYAVLTVMRNIYELDDEPMTGASSISDVFDQRRRKLLILWNADTAPDSLNLVIDIVKKQLVLKKYLTGPEPKPKKLSLMNQWLLGFASNSVDRLGIEEEISSDCYLKCFDKTVNFLVKIIEEELFDELLDDFL